MENKKQKKIKKEKEPKVQIMADLFEPDCLDELLAVKKETRVLKIKKK